MEVPVAKVLPYVPAFLWAALILYIGGRSNVPTVDSTLPLDKAAHFVMYGVLGALVTRGWIKTRSDSEPGASVLWVLVLAMAVGMMDELHQRRVPGRSPEFKDWIADAAGVAVASSLVLRFYKKGSSNVVRD
jgi:VanZ family protein